MTRHSVKTALFGVLAIATAAVCIRLGIWQLDRLQQRRAQNAIIASRRAVLPVGISALQGRDTAEIHWRQVTVRGVAAYGAEYVHATRSQSGSPGVHLLTPVRPLDGAWGDTALLLLRGYVYSPDGRTFDREKAREGDTVSFDALVTSFPPPRSGEVQMPSDGQAVRRLNRDTLAMLMARPLAPFVLLVLGDTAVRDLTLPARVPPPSLSEGPHQSYAFQWFGFAIVFLVGISVFIWGSGRRSAQTHSGEPDSGQDMGGVGTS